MSEFNNLAVEFSEVWSWSSNFTKAEIQEVDDNLTQINLTRGQKDATKDAGNSIESSILLNSSSQSSVKLGNLSTNHDGTMKSIASPSGNSRVILWEGEKDASKDSNPMIEIYRKKNECRSRLSMKDYHGKFVVDDWFGGVSWSGDERKVTYVALKKSLKKSTFFESFFDKNESSTKMEEKEENEDTSINKYEYVEDWGETFVGYSNLVVVVLDVLTLDMELIEVSDCLTCGQPQLSYDGKTLIFTGWSASPRKLGMVYCFNRPCSLFRVILDDNENSKENEVAEQEEGDPFSIKSISPNKRSDYSCITPNLRLARSPRFSPDGSKVVFLGSDGFDCHNGPMSLYLMTNTGISKIIPVVDESDLSPGQGGFPGIWTSSLPSNPFISPSTLVLTSMWGSRSVLLSVDISSEDENAQVFRWPLTLKDKDDKLATIQPIPITSNQPLSKEESVSVSLLGCSSSSSKIVFSISSPTSPPQVHCLFLSNNEDEGWIQLLLQSPLMTASSQIPLPIRDVVGVMRQFEELRWELIENDPEDGSNHIFESILITSPSSLTPSPLLVIPHGGPHSCYPTCFFAPYVWLSCLRGYSILYVNYRGSTGFCANSLFSLPGHCGFQDVKDVEDATKKVLSLKVGELDENRVGIVGGSHGGFLAGHMIGQHPTLFKAACMRNPVTNISSMFTLSDIPDWCKIEVLGLGSYEWDDFIPPNADQLVKMYNASPVSHLPSITAPTLLLLGGKDLRVPLRQGVEFYHALKANLVTTKMKIYPEDTHALSKAATEGDHWIEIVNWMDTHL